MNPLHSTRCRGLSVCFSNSCCLSLDRIQLPTGCRFNMTPKKTDGTSRQPAIRIRELRLHRDFKLIISKGGTREKCQRRFLFCSTRTNYWSWWSRHDSWVLCIPPPRNRIFSSKPPRHRSSSEWKKIGWGRGCTCGILPSPSSLNRRHTVRL